MQKPPALVLPYRDADRYWTQRIGSDWDGEVYAHSGAFVEIVGHIGSF